MTIGALVGRLSGGRRRRTADGALLARCVRGDESRPVPRRAGGGTGAVPDDRTVVVERFRDEIGDWRVCILTPFGTPVHAPWAMAIERQLMDRYDIPVETMWGDDGIVVRLPESADELPVEAMLVDPEDIDELVVATLPQTALFSARFRECAGRALLLPRRRPDRRTPLWQQRQRAADLLAVASKFPTFPILLEASRECLQDVFDVPALREVLGLLRSRTGPGRHRRHRQGQPDGVEPAVQLDRRLHVRRRRTARRASCRGAGARPRSAAGPARRRGTPRAARPRCVGRRRARTAVRGRTPAGPLGRRAPRRAAQGRRPHRCRDRPALHRRSRAAPGPTFRRLSTTRRRRGLGRRWVRQLVEEKRAIEIGVGGEIRFAAAEDAARYRDAFGCAIPIGLPMAFTDPVARPLEELVGRYARTHGPFVAADVSPGSGRRPNGSQGRLRRSKVRTAWCSASSAPTGCRASSSTSTSCASSGGVRLPRCDARSNRSSRRCSPDSCRRGTRSLLERRGAEALVESLTVLSGRGARRIDDRGRRAARSGRRVSAVDARRAVHGGRGGLGRCRRGRCPRRSGSSHVRRPVRRSLRRAGRRATVPTGRSTTRSELLLAERGASFWNQMRGAAPGVERRRDPRRTLGSRVGRRGHERLAGAAACGGRRCQGQVDQGDVALVAGRRPATPGAAQPDRSAGRSGAVEPRRAAARTRTAPDRGVACAGAADGRAVRRGDPRGGARRGGRAAGSPTCTAC